MYKQNIRESLFATKIGNNFIGFWICPFRLKNPCTYNLLFINGRQNLELISGNYIRLKKKLSCLHVLPVFRSWVLL
jgi:hypothetical protein